MKEISCDFDLLVAVIRAQNLSRIGIDGVSGAGKSETSRALAPLLGLPVIKLDDYVQKGKKLR